MYDYTIEKYPKFACHPDALPSIEQRVINCNYSTGRNRRVINPFDLELFQLHFIRCYLETVQREMADDDSHKNLVINSIGTGPKNEVRLLREADCYMLASHFFWGLWAVVNASVSSIPFGYWVGFCNYNKKRVLFRWCLLIDVDDRNMLRLGSPPILSTSSTCCANMERLSRTSLEHTHESNFVIKTTFLAFIMLLLLLCKDFRTG